MLKAVFQAFQNLPICKISRFILFLFGFICEYLNNQHKEDEMSLW